MSEVNMNGKGVVVLVMALAAGACMTGPRPVGYTPADYLSASPRSRVWLTLNDGRQTIVEGPRVITDTVFGWNSTGTEEVMIPVADIREVRAQKMSVVRTALIPAAAVAGTIAALFLIETDGSAAPPSLSDSLDGEIDL
jgi:hypothetical protein